jgi:hypothetical protein
MFLIMLLYVFALYDDIELCDSNYVTLCVMVMVICVMIVVICVMVMLICVMVMATLTCH